VGGKRSRPAPSSRRAKEDATASRATSPASAPTRRPICRRRRCAPSRRAGAPREVSFDRKDYKRAEVDAWNAYELDRRREDARKLYLAARREGHIQFDDAYRIERIERLARVNEEIHSADPAVRGPGLSRGLAAPRAAQAARDRQPARRAWMANLNEKLDQRVTFEFSDQGFEDVVNFLRQVTGVKLIVAPEVTAAAAAAPSRSRSRNALRDALKWISELTTCTWRCREQAIYISNKACAGAITSRCTTVTD